MGLIGAADSIIVSCVLMWTYRVLNGKKNARCMREEGIADRHDRKDDASPQFRHECAVAPAPLFSY
jgi:hypothetical protein